MYADNEQEASLGLYNLQNVVLVHPDNIFGLNDVEQCMDRATADSYWKILKQAIQQIQRKQYSKLNYEELYRYTYSLVLHKYGGLLYTGLCDTISQHITSKVKSKILSNFNSNFLSSLNSLWDDYQISLLMIRDILIYMDRVYVQQNNVDDVYSLGLNLFKNLVVQYGRIRTYLQETLLRQVLKERRGQLMDRLAFKRVTKMLMDLGNNSSEVYQENFEKPFLQESAKFFRIESEQLLQENNASLYLRQVESRIYEELERAELCFDKMTAFKIINVLEDELIKSCMETIVEMNNSGVVHMMHNQLTEDLTRMYKLLGRVSGGLKTLFNCFSHYLRQQGRALNLDEDINNNPVIYVQNLLDLKELTDFYLCNCFSNDKLCGQTIALDFEYILNLNPRSAEYFSIFIDDKLKKTVKGMTDDDKTILLEKTMVLFRFLQDKDLFEIFYKQLLAKRLLVGKPINEENEKNIIVKLKNECGFQFTRNLEGMFKDILKSIYITEEFRKHANSNFDIAHGVDICIRILTTAHWPTQTIPLPCTLPVAALTAFEHFKKFYLSLHCGRQLTLLPQLGTVELEACFEQPHCEDGGEGWSGGLPAQTLGSGEIRSYTLQVSTYQMCVLMLFNDRPRWTFQELQAEINITSKDMIRALQSLVTGRSSQGILLKQPGSTKVQESDSFFINTSFTSKSNRIKIPPCQVKYEADSDRQDTIKKATEDRHHEVEAAIIRVLKSRRLINHDDLMNEVIKMLSPRFIPTRDVVKTRIEVLIEREYIARNMEDRRIYEYVPG